MFSQLTIVFCLGKSWRDVENSFPACQISSNAASIFFIPQYNETINTAVPGSSATYSIEVRYSNRGVLVETQTLFDGIMSKPLTKYESSLFIELFGRKNCCVPQAWRSGVRDVFTVLFYTVASVTVHAIIQEYVIDKLCKRVTSKVGGFVIIMKSFSQPKKSENVSMFLTVVRKACENDLLR